MVPKRITTLACWLSLSVSKEDNTVSAIALPMAVSDFFCNIKRGSALQWFRYVMVLVSFTDIDPVEKSSRVAVDVLGDGEGDGGAALASE
ncbi:hypothetical protein Syun_007641 [Stephania yunnanensis]|uniref:Uncharacterized protein n=1 Tax=Stephania yunnanensis TaxID=152371 RepID=A0AAP0KZW8_9MAGN